jgi:TRAP-type C4-dicarboxylate transport system substrate-binding protein
VDATSQSSRSNIIPFSGDSLTDEEKKIVDEAAMVAVEAGRGISRIIEASAEKGLPKLAQKMKINAVDPAELEAFAKASQPAVRKIIAEKLGDDGVAMMEAMLANIDKVK